MPTYKAPDKLLPTQDPSVASDFFVFMKENPFPSEDDIEGFKKEKKLSDTEYNQLIFSFLTVMLSGGKSQQQDEIKKPEDSTEEDKKKEVKQIEQGKKVETEHLYTQSKDNPLVNQIISILASKISRDHVAEITDYYDRLRKMEKNATASDGEVKLDPAEKEGKPKLVDGLEEDSPYGSAPAPFTFSLDDPKRTDAPCHPEDCDCDDCQAIGDDEEYMEPMGDDKEYETSIYENTKRPFRVERFPRYKFRA